MLTRYQRKRLMDSIEVLDAFRHFNLKVIRDGMGRYVCSCPFHAEKTPSLKVYPNENTWYAFCCGRGSTVWDLIKYREESFDAAEQTLKQLATIELPEDPLEDIANELKEKTKNDIRAKIEITSSVIGIILRDFLKAKRDDPNYRTFTEQVDKWFFRLDELLEYEDLDPDEIEQFNRDVNRYIREASGV